MEPAGENGAATGRWRSRRPPPATGPARPPGPAQPSAASAAPPPPPGAPAASPRAAARLPRQTHPFLPLLPGLARLPTRGCDGGERRSAAGTPCYRPSRVPPPTQQRCPAAGGPLPAAGGAGRPGHCDRRAAPRVPEPPPPLPAPGPPRPALARAAGTARARPGQRPGLEAERRSGRSWTRGCARGCRERLPALSGAAPPSQERPQRRRLGRGRVRVRAPGRLGVVTSGAGPGVTAGANGPAGSAG